MFNLSRCGRAFFDHGISDEVNDLLIDEFGHHYASDHLTPTITGCSARWVLAWSGWPSIDQKCSGSLTLFPHESWSSNLTFSHFVV